MTALHWAAYEGHVDVIALLLERNANIEATDEVSRIVYVPEMDEGLIALMTVEMAVQSA